MGRKKNGQGKRRGKKKQIAAREEAEAEAQAKPSFPNIPEEIVVEILSRLPLRSLPRFSCVSKQWRSMVTDVVAKITGRKMVLVQSIDWSGRSDTFDSIDEGSRVQRVRKPWKNNASYHYPTYPVFCGSCNGLLLINIEDGLFLWNPVTRYFKEVLSHKYLAERSRMVLGLCYDSSTHDYKAVMGHSYERPYDSGKFVHVGSFRNRSWTRVQLPYNLYTVRSGDSGPIVNGHLHWHVSESESIYHVHQILHFNPRTNQFGKVPMPEAKNGTNGNMIFGLGVLDGCLCMVRGDFWSLSKAKSLEVLAMREYGIQNSWTKLFSISNLPLMLDPYHSYGTLEPLCYTKDGEVMVRFLSRSRNLEGVWVYNPINSFFSQIQIEPGCRMVDVVTYEEILDHGPMEELRGRSTYVQHYDYGPPCKWIKMSNGQWRCFEID